MNRIKRHAVGGSLRRAALGLGALGLVMGAAQAQANEDLLCSMEAPVFAGERVSLRDGASIVGVDGELTHVLSNGRVHLRRGALLEGDVTAARVRMSRSSEILGEIVQTSPGVEPADASDLVESYRANNDNHHVPLTMKGRVALRGGYLTVRRGDHLVLPEGDYFLEMLRVRRGATLELAGPVRIYMDRGLVNVHKGRIIGAEEADLSIIIAREGLVRVGGESGFHASVYAPHSLLSLKGKGVASGSLVARRIWVSDGAEFVASDLCMEGPPVLDEDRTCRPAIRRMCRPIRRRRPAVATGRLSRATCPTSRPIRLADRARCRVEGVIRTRRRPRASW